MDALTLMVVLLIYTVIFIIVVIFISFGWINFGDYRVVKAVVKNVEICIKKFIPSAVLKWTENTKNYLFYERNQLFQLFYATLLTIGYASYTQTAFPYVSESHIGRAPYYLLIINLLLFAVCSCSDPGIVTRENLSKHLTDYEYDGYLYIPKECNTCLLKKPARSKHCSLCNHCVARFDHHCAFLNVCIGRNNVRYFAAFLLSLVLICGVSSFMIIMVFIHIVNTKELHLASFVDKFGMVHNASLRTVIQYLAMSHPVMAILLLFLVCLFVALACFLLFHILLILTNQTTNELFKKGTESQRQPGSGHRMKREDRSHGSWRLVGRYSKGLIRNIAEVLFPQ